MGCQQKHKKLKYNLQTVIQKVNTCAKLMFLHTYLSRVFIGNYINDIAILNFVATVM